MIKRIGQMTGLIVGSMMSPSWILLPMVLKPCFDMHRAAEGGIMLLYEIHRFQAYTETHVHEVFVTMLPMLVLMLCMSATFITLMSQLGGWVATMAYAKPDGEVPVESGIRVTMNPAMRIASPWTR